MDKSSFCHEWWNARLKNPESKRKIKRNGPTYQKLKIICGEPSDQYPRTELKAKGRKYVSPPFNPSRSPQLDQASPPNEPGAKRLRIPAWSDPNPLGLPRHINRVRVDPPLLSISQTWHKVSVPTPSSSAPLTQESMLKWYRKHASHFPLDWLTMHLTFHTKLLPPFLTSQLEESTHLEKIATSIYDKLNHNEDSKYTRNNFERILDEVEKENIPPPLPSPYTEYTTEFIIGWYSRFAVIFPMNMGEIFATFEPHSLPDSIRDQRRKYKKIKSISDDICRYVKAEAIASQTCSKTSFNTILENVREKYKDKSVEKPKSPPSQYREYSIYDIIGWYRKLSVGRPRLYPLTKFNIKIIDPDHLPPFLKLIIDVRRKNEYNNTVRSIANHIYGVVLEKIKETTSISEDEFLSILDSVIYQTRL